MVNWTYPKDFFKQRKRWMQGIYMVCRLFFFRICSQIFYLIYCSWKYWSKWRCSLVSDQGSFRWNPSSSSQFLWVSSSYCNFTPIFFNIMKIDLNQNAISDILNQIRLSLSLRPKCFYFSAAWLTMPLTTLNVVLSKAYPMSVSPSIDFLVRWILVTRIDTPSVHVY